MVSKRKNKRQQWRRQQQKAKKKANKEAKKLNEHYDKQAKWFRDSIRLCQERFKNICEAENTKVVNKGHDGVPLPETILGVDIDSTNGDAMDELLEAVDELATIWATREWPSVRAHHLKTIMPGKVLDEQHLLDYVDDMMPGFKEIEIKRLKTGFKSKCGLPLTEDEHTCIQTGEWGFAKMLKKSGLRV